MYLLLQEIEVWYIIPAIRKEFAELLTKKHGLSYEKAGQALGVSKAAVSQYISNKRANKITLAAKVKGEIEKSAEKIAKNPSCAMEQIERILKYMQTNKYSCEIHKNYNKDVHNYCESQIISS